MPFIIARKLYNIHREVNYRDKLFSYLLMTCCVSETVTGGAMTGTGPRVGAGRGSARSLPERERGPRRRDKDTLLRYNSRPRSPK